MDRQREFDKAALDLSKSKHTNFKLYVNSVNQAENDHEKIQQLYMTPQLHGEKMYTTNNYEDDDDNDAVYDFFL